MTQVVANGKAAEPFSSEHETTDHLLNAGNRAFGRRSRQLLGSAFARLGPVKRRDQRIADRDQRIADRDQRIADRDQRIADLTRRAKHLEEQRRRLAKGPSFQVRLDEERRLRAWESELGAPSRSVIAGGKFHVYDLVRSHGIDVPEQLGRWHDPADIPWDGLPDAVVIKSAHGAASRGVLPLRRVDGGWQVATRDATVTSEQLTADLAALAANERSGLRSAPRSSSTTAAGRPRSTSRSTRSTARLRSPFCAGSSSTAPEGPPRIGLSTGTALTSSTRTVGKPTDPTIPLPGALADLFDVAERVSIVIRAPFSRIDLYDIRGRIVFGEVTPCPGSPGWFGPDLDVTMGEAWERAQVRLWRDIAEGASREAEWGPLGASAGSTSATDACPRELLIGTGG